MLAPRRQTVTLPRAKAKLCRRVRACKLSTTFSDINEIVDQDHIVEREYSCLNMTNKHNEKDEFWEGNLPTAFDSAIVPQVRHATETIQQNEG